MGIFPFAGVAQRRTSTITPGGSQPARFVPVGPGHDRHRRPDGCLLHHATRRTGAGHALGHLRRGSLSLGHELDRHFACRIWYSTFTRPVMITGPVTTGARRKAGTHARNDCRRRRLHPACLGDKGMDGVPDYGPACFGWHRNAGAASSVVQCR